MKRYLENRETDIITFSRRALSIGVATALLRGRTAFAQVKDAGFQGSTIRFLVGIPPGGAYDLVARTVAVYLGRYLPGNPAVIVENMPGASSLRMMNYLYNSAPRDGTVIGFPMNSVMLEPSLGLIARSGGVASFDLSKMTWLGSVGQDPTVIWVGGNSDIREFNDLKTRPCRLAATAPAADSYLVATLCNQLLGTKISIIAGYPGVAQYLVAFEQGEVDGAATTYAALAAARPDWLASGRIRLLAQFGAVRSPALPDLPTGAELAGDAGVRDMLTLFGQKFTATYPAVLGPGVPADRIPLLDHAFDMTMRDPEFVARIGRLFLSPGNVSGAMVARTVEQVLNASPQTISGLKKALSF